MLNNLFPYIGLTLLTFFITFLALALEFGTKTDKPSKTANIITDANKH